MCQCKSIGVGDVGGDKRFHCNNKITQKTNQKPRVKRRSIEKKDIGFYSQDNQKEKENIYYRSPIFIFNTIKLKNPKKKKKKMKTRSLKGK